MDPNRNRDCRRLGEYWPVIIKYKTDWDSHSDLCRRRSLSEAIAATRGTADEVAIITAGERGGTFNEVRRGGSVLAADFRTALK